MLSKQSIMLVVVCALVGFIGAGIKRGWIIVALPSRTSIVAETVAHEKQCAFWFLTAQGWQSEKKNCVWPKDTAQALEHLINAWLTVLTEEGLLTMPTTLVNALLSPEQTAYLSFDRSPFNREDSLRTQWFFVEGLLKTIREALPEIRQVIFLVNNQPLHHRQLDLEHPWPINGFLN